jgi:hypothetical protein
LRRRRRSRLSDEPDLREAQPGTNAASPSVQPLHAPAIEPWSAPKVAVTLSGPTAPSRRHTACPRTAPRKAVDGRKGESMRCCPMHAAGKHTQYAPANGPAVDGLGAGGASSVTGPLRALGRTAPSHVNELILLDCRAVVVAFAFGHALDQILRRAHTFLTFVCGAGRSD